MWRALDIFPEASLHLGEEEAAERLSTPSATHLFNPFTPAAQRADPTQREPLRRRRGSRDHFTPWLFPLAPTLWRSGRGEVIVYRRMQGLTDACVRWRLDTWRSIHLDSDSSRNTKDTCWMEREEQTLLNPFPMFPWWWRKNIKDLLFFRQCLLLILSTKLVKWEHPSYVMS